jgi:hypothetical protein
MVSVVSDAVFLALHKNERKILTDRSLIIKFTTAKLDLAIICLDSPVTFGTACTSLSLYAYCWNSQGPSGARGSSYVCRTTTGQVDWRKRVRSQ